MRLCDNQNWKCNVDTHQPETYVKYYFPYRRIFFIYFFFLRENPQMHCAPCAALCRAGPFLHMSCSTCCVRSDLPARCSGVATEQKWSGQSMLFVDHGLISEIALSFYRWAMVHAPVLQSNVLTPIRQQLIFINIILIKKRKRLINNCLGNSGCVYELSCNF